MTSSVAGRCLCGKITYEVDLPFGRIVNCHCSRCRTASGAACATNGLLPPVQFRWTAGETEISRFDLPEAASFATAFCRTCGSLLPHMTRSGRSMIVPIGALDLDDGPTADVHWRSRARWFSDEPLPRED